MNTNFNFLAILQTANLYKSQRITEEEREHLKQLIFTEDSTLKHLFGTYSDEECLQSEIIKHTKETL